MKLLCKLFGHDLIPDFSNKDPHTWECSRCGKKELAIFLFYSKIESRV